MGRPVSSIKKIGPRSAYPWLGHPGELATEARLLIVSNFPILSTHVSNLNVLVIVLCAQKKLTSLISRCGQQHGYNALCIYTLEGDNDLVHGTREGYVQSARM